MTSFDRSHDLFERAERVIPLGTQTLSKHPSQWVQGAHPRYLVRGRGAHVWDVDGNEYVDFPMALGPVLLGYAEPVVDDAVRRQLDDGITFTLMHPLEVEVAERIVALCPGVDAVRFGKSGSDAVSAAVRAARAITGRDRVLVAGYHGWHDWYIASTTRDAGVPKAVVDLTATFTFGDLASLERALETYPDEVAAVVLEPSGATVPEPGYLEAVVDLTRRHGAVSVFDEVITGFRLAPGGARERYGVQPDLSCYGKALGNGMPISAVGGRAAVMAVFKEVFYSGTHGGEALSLAAAGAVLDAIADGEVLGHIERLGSDLQQGLRALVDEHGVAHLVTVGGEPHRTVVGFPGPDELVHKSWVQQCLGQAGVLFNGSLFPCFRHTEDDVALALDAFDGALGALGRGEDVAARLVGPPVEPVFRPVR
ncbi:MAG: aminotransferase class III-fold pyridoxal phosphate-dependent enzyme [Acidimicrobiales bacterium]|nr:aminotransferase class III-fold pyridoxal phosphate-dependent enzyme [Acidimicrobiales bacterium]MCB1014239.1 aminotransferase class III-fold pyridoxal phosphate-dependent enzyme [Acidimicrobiales bacterium]MCB9372583.1 aminotransferase class III-fold pyridoxal phosphate-dependent enzyme [Microthrixaceae bacterium]